MLSLLSFFAVAGEETRSPSQVVEVAVFGLQDELIERRKFYANNPAELYALMRTRLLPNFDVNYAGKLVLGKAHWPTATEEQRARFISVFTDFLIRTYAKGILELRTEGLVIQPVASYSKDGEKALVRTELTIEGGQNALVNYSMRMVNGQWRIYDIRIDGVSYVQNYRNQFDAEISAQGLEAVIIRLENEVQKSDKSVVAEVS